jgi:hypothetical protein
MPLTSNECNPQKSAIWSKLSAVLSISHTAVALGMSGKDIFSPFLEPVGSKDKKSTKLGMRLYRTV